MWFQLTHFSSDDCEYIYIYLYIYIHFVLLSSSNRKYESYCYYLRLGHKKWCALYVLGFKGRRTWSMMEYQNYHNTVYICAYYAENSLRSHSFTPRSIDGLAHVTARDPTSWILPLSNTEYNDFNDLPRRIQNNLASQFQGFPYILIWNIIGKAWNYHYWNTSETNNIWWVLSLRGSRFKSIFSVCKAHWPLTNPDMIL